MTRSGERSSTLPAVTTAADRSQDLLLNDLRALGAR